MTEDKHNEKEAEKRMAAALKRALNPKPHDSNLMRGSEDTYRNTCGEYRIIYKFDKSTLAVSIIEKRNDSKVYRIHKRRS